MNLGPYTVERKIEKHGVASVYVARHHKTGEVVLLTVISPAILAWRSRLEAVKALRHPNILPIQEIGEEGDLLYAVSPMLYPVLANDRVLAPAVGSILVRQVGAALDHAHQNGIIHGCLHRLHLVKRVDNKASVQVIVRGFDLDPGSAEPAEDISALGSIFYRALMGQDLLVDAEGIHPPPVFPLPLREVMGQTFDSGKALAAAVAAAVEQLPEADWGRPLGKQTPAPAMPRRPNTPARRSVPDLARPVTPVRAAPQRNKRSPILRLLVILLFIAILITLVVGADILLTAKSPEKPDGTAKVVYVVVTATETATAAENPSLAISPAASVSTETPVPGAMLAADSSPSLATTEINLPASTLTQTPTATFTEGRTATSSPSPTLTLSPTPTVTLTLALAPSRTAAPSTPTPLPTTDIPTPSSPNATVPDGEGAIMRTGPGSLYFDETTIEPGTLLYALERSDDNQWVKVRYQATEGWVYTDSLKLNVDLLSLPVATPAEIAAIPMTRRCVSVVGDSVTHGGVTFEVPATGYIIALTVPVAIYVEQQFRIVGIQDVQVLDRGVSHTGISTANHPSYFKTPTYQKLLTDRCEFTIVMPWLNDITADVPPEEALPAHIKALASLIGDVLARNPTGQVLLMNYYQGATAQFALDTWAKGVTRENIAYYNGGLAAACKDGVFSTIVQVTCMDIQPAFDNMGVNYVIGPITQQGFYSLLISDLNPTYKAWMDAYTKASPDGLLFGDGVHLSPAGKTALAIYLVNIIQASKTPF